MFLRDYERKVILEKEGWVGSDHGLLQFIDGLIQQLHT